MRDVSARKISRGRLYLGRKLYKRKEKSTESKQFAVYYSLEFDCASFTCFAEEKIKVETRWRDARLGEYVEIRVERSSLLKDRAGGDLCRVGTVYL